uniref:NADH dehydrogenase subunit 6 n=1 Tax=Pseudoniphargus sp. 2-Canaries TaxID=2212670 RepID=A0A345UE90_9CRUS|nr:NADH dehydrogenase subunit 6 [Pseudoniphargus sp. 2-Canaries]
MAQLFSMMSIILSALFLMKSPPLFLSMMIISQTINLAIITALFTMSSWFSFMLLMIYLSGMMIIFIYVSSMASNELFYTNIKMLPSMLLGLTIITSIYLSWHSFLPSDSMSMLDLNLLQVSVFKTMKMYSKSLFMMTILLIIYLLMTMIVVVKNSSFSEGPMRSHK